MRTVALITTRPKKAANKKKYSGVLAMKLFRCADSSTSQLRLWQSVFGALVLLISSGELTAGQVISATQVVVVETQDASFTDGSESELTAIGGTRAKAIGGTRAKAIGGTRAKAIGGTRAKAIGGTRAKAIGGTRAKAIGGTRAKAIGGTRAKAIGGTRAKAIGGTRAKAIGGTRAKAIGGTRAKAIGGTRAKAIGGTRAKAIGGTRLLAVADTQVRAITGATLTDSAHSLVAPPVSELATVSFMGESYDWIVIAPLQYMEQGRASALGYELEFQDESTLQSLFNTQSMVVVASRHSDGQVVSLATSDTFVSGVTEVVTAARVDSIDASTGTLILSSGVVVDYTQLLSNQSQLAVSQGDFVFVQGHLY
jgi:hypothetical protein